MADLEQRSGLDPGASPLCALTRTPTWRTIWCRTRVRAAPEHLLFAVVRSWLYTILTNLNRNRLRSLARRPIHTPIEDDDAIDLAGPEAGMRDVERALGTLVEDQRVALLLVVLEGLTYREVAEIQGVPIGTVMSRLARARAQIKSYLDGERPALRRVK